MRPPPIPSVCAVPSLYSACNAISCRLGSDVVAGTIWPAAASASETWNRLTDGTTVTNTASAAGYGVRTTAGMNPYITLTMDDVVSVAALGLWPWTDSNANIALGRNITIWLHSASANFSADPSPVKCRDAVDLITRFEILAQCMNATAARYVTLQRVWNVSTQLGVQEVAVYLDRELYVASHTQTGCRCLICGAASARRGTLPCCCAARRPVAGQCCGIGDGDGDGETQQAFDQAERGEGKGELRTGSDGWHAGSAPRHTYHALMPILT